MKNLFKTIFVAALAFIFVSCGSVSKENFVGSWSPDLGSVDIHLSEAIPNEYRDQMDIEDVKKEMASEQDQADKMILEFKEDGTFTVGPEGDTKDFNWSVSGSELIISGTMPEEADEVGGQDFEFAFEVVESTADEFTLKLTGSSIMDQAKENFEEQVEEAMGQAGPFLAMIDLEAILSDTWASMTFKKKSAEA